MVSRDSLFPKSQKSDQTVHRGLSVSVCYLQIPDRLLHGVHLLVLSGWLLVPSLLFAAFHAVL
jgi:hypothetical protein